MHPSIRAMRRTLLRPPLQSYDRPMTNLFQAAGLESEAPRPLADRLRPCRLAEVVGQDHLVGPEGTLTRALKARRLQSMILWGPPGTGKTTAARLLQTRPISPSSSCRPSSPASRTCARPSTGPAAGARPARARCS